MRLSGLPASRAPFAADNDDFRASVASFPARLTPEFATELHDAGRAFLHRHQIHDEPVTWHPPLTLLSDLELPGPYLGQVKIAEVHQIIRQDRATLQATADLLRCQVAA